MLRLADTDTPRRHQCVIRALSCAAALLCCGCHLIFPFDPAPVDSGDATAEGRPDGGDLDAADGADGPTVADQGLDLPLDLPGADTLLGDAPSSDQPWLPDAAAPADTTPAPDQPWPPDAAVADTVPTPDVTASPDSTPAPDGPLPPTGVLEANSYGNTGDDGAKAVAVDSSGNIYVIGWFSGTVYFGEGCGSHTSAGDWDIFLASYNPAGSCRWAKRFGGVGRELGRAVAVDPNGNVTITGSFESASVDFGGGAQTNTDALGNSFDFFVASYSSSGAYRWADVSGYTGVHDYGDGVTADGAGNVTVTGVFVEALNLGCASLKTNGASADIFVASYDANGACRWGKNFGSTLGAEVGRAVASDPNGNVYLTGGFYFNTNFGGPQRSSNGDEDVFVASYDANGGYRWDQTFGDTDIDAGLGLAVDPSGFVYVTGYFSQNPTVGTTALSSAGSTDGFLARYTTSGAFDWAQGFGGPGADASESVAVDPATGHVYVTGRLQGTAIVLGTPLTSVGNYDAFVASTDSAGNPRWAKRFGGIGNDFGYGVVVSGDVIVTGQFQYTVNLGIKQLVSAGQGDIFLVKFGP